MNRRLLASAIAGATLAVPLALAAQLPDSLATRVDRVFAQYATTTSPGCVVGVGQNGREVYAKAYGMANLEYGVALTAESISESGSVAKQFTAAALALLQLEGKLTLEDDIRKYLPEVPDFGQRITIRHLLNHTSGIRDQWAMWGLVGREPGREVHSIPKVLDLVSHQRELNFPTGSEYLYSNTGYTLASVIVTRVAGMPFAKFTEERFFKPLGMRDTQWRDDYRRIVPRRATAYSREGNTWVQDMPFTNVHGNGGLLTTVGDWLRWNVALDEGLLGKPELTRMLETRGKLADGRTLAYALGLSVAEARKGIQEISHGGATAGYRTFLARYPAAGRLSVALLCNAANANATGLARQVAAVFLPPAPASDSAVAAPVAAEERERLAGSYRNPASDEWFVITSVRDELRLTGGNNIALIPDGPDAYRTRSGLRFRVQRSGATVTALLRTDSDGHAMSFDRMTRPELTREQLTAYAGAYRSPELAATITVAVDSGQLVARFAPSDSARLVPLYRDGFRIGTAPWTVRFVRDQRGDITQLRAFVGRARNVLFERVAGAR